VINPSLGNTWIANPTAFFASTHRQLLLASLKEALSRAVGEHGEHVVRSTCWPSKEMCLDSHIYRIHTLIPNVNLLDEKSNGAF
jgi:hypothetical protein